jgi:hypothetical protein
MITPTPAQGNPKAIVLAGQLRGATLRVERASGWHPELIGREVEVVPAEGDGWVIKELARLDGRAIGVHGELDGNAVTVTGIWPTM